MYKGALTFLIAGILSTDTIAVGGWEKVDVTSESGVLLTKAMHASGTQYCFTGISQLEKQVVAGTNYKFHVNGCDVMDKSENGECTVKAASCSPTSYIITVFEQPWSNTLKVTDVTKVHEDDVISIQEKIRIDKWLSKNGLNRYGDPKGTSYLGGSPLYNESTGETTDRFVYLREKFPDCPWKQ